MTNEQQLDPAVAKLLDYGKSKKEITWDEINELLTPEVVNSDTMDDILILLEKNNVQIKEEDSNAFLDSCQYTHSYQNHYGYNDGFYF